MKNTAEWGGYAFDVAFQNSNWDMVPGIYIFCGVNPQNRWVPIYIGQTDNLRTRIQWHEQWNPAERLGATHVHAMRVDSQRDRDGLEQWLIEQFQPALNVQHK